MEVERTLLAFIYSPRTNKSNIRNYMKSRLGLHIRCRPAFRKQWYEGGLKSYVIHRKIRCQLLG